VRVILVAKLTDIALYDYRNPGVDPRTKISGDRAAAMNEKSKKENPGAWGYHDDTLENGNGHGLGVMLQAVTITIKSEGTEVHGKITVFGNRTKGQALAGAIIFSKLNGLSTLIGSFVEVDYRPYALQRLGNSGR
jgi:hypothetical protein